MEDALKHIVVHVRQSFRTIQAIHKRNELPRQGTISQALACPQRIPDSQMGQEFAENTVLVGSWTRSWVLSRSTFLWQLDLGLDHSGALWLLYKQAHRSPNIKRQSGK